MPCRNAVDTTRESQRQNGHLVARIGGTSVADSHKLVARDTHRIPERSCYLLDFLSGKDVVSRGHWRVRRKHAARTDLILRGGKGDAVRAQLAQPFHVHECGVTFVQMPDLGIDAERAQNANAADAEHPFLS